MAFLGSVDTSTLKPSSNFSISGCLSEMRFTSPKTTDELKWASFVLFLAALYNAAWGAIAITAPLEMLAFFGVFDQLNTEFWQCIGLFVAVYGVGYWFASTDPVRYWPFVLIGLIGKVLGPVGAALSIASGSLPTTFLWVNVTNDFVWWVPFVWILWMVHQRGAQFPRFSRSDPDATLYRRALGPQFDELAPRIRRFHDATGPVEVHGMLSVTRGASSIGNWLLDRSGFPRSHESLNVSLVIEPSADGETWRRAFGDLIVESWQYEGHGYLAERFGPLVMYLQPQVLAGALEVTDVRSTILGIPLPPFLTPRVHAQEIDKDDGIEITVRIASSPLGLLIEYHGIIVPTGSPLEVGAA